MYYAAGMVVSLFFFFFNVDICRNILIESCICCRLSREKKRHESCRSALHLIISNWFGSPTSQHILSV